ncbi:MAG: CDP-alcohol phosphatidyltransferase family protein [Gemmataceae bacterium]|nr:CDP-alcohol phosphatidyltransferase family protein [Gemmataceae bacterium]
MTKTPYQPTERRPIASRNLRVMLWLATQLVRLKVSANAISVAGMFCAIFGGLASAATASWPEFDRLFWLSAAVLIQLRLLANLLDGMVAIESGQASAVGELYNEVPDRVSDSALLIGAGYAAGGDIVLGFSAACVALFTAYVRAMGKAAGAPSEFCGPMAKQQRMFVLTVLALFHGATPAAWQLRWHDWGFLAGGLAIIIVLGTLTALRRLFRIAASLKRPHE